MVGGHDQQVVLAHPADELRDARVDPLQRPREPLDVLAVPVALVGLDQVREREPRRHRLRQRGDRVERLLVAGPRQRLAHPAPGEQVGDLADSDDGQAGALDLLQVARPGRREREVTPPRGALERPGAAGERARDHAPDAIGPAHQLPRPLARLVQLRFGDHLYVPGELQHRVLRGVEDQSAGAHVLLAEVLDRRQPVVRAVTDHLPADRLLQAPYERLGESLGVGRQRRRQRDPHQLPVPGDRVLARSERRQPPVDRRVPGSGGRRRSPRSTQPERPHRGQPQPARRLGEVAERVRALVAVGGGVG